MTHQYEYDADNRITAVETSTDGVFFDSDAKYFYYAHGPLARTELVENQVQGLDYVYTLQGWIKGVNSNTLDSTRDVGQDGNRVTGNPNAYFAKDVFGYTLNFFAGDYTAINSTVSQTGNNFEPDKTGSDLLANREDFFNGNISAMVTTITNPTTGEVLPQGMAYSYDQLNRILSAKAFDNIDIATNTWQSGSIYNNRYYNAFTYDANGNILTQQRYGENGTQIEDMTYIYNRNTGGEMLENRLYHVNDNVSSTVFSDDIDDQGVFSTTNVNSSNNYGYDGEGRLIRDDAEEIAQITWTITGKVKEVIRTGGSFKKNLKFRYDAMEQRIAKEVYDSQGNWEKTTYYVRDPQGNVMGIYEKKNDAQTQQFSYKILERNIYGSSMVGLIKSNTELIGSPLPSTTTFTHAVGEKQFYLSNHLSNNLSTVSDMIIAHDWDNDNAVDYYRAEIISATDFTPFGFSLDGRTFNSNEARHGFNGKEKDDEWNVDGGSYDFGARMYDSRLGRWLSGDPLAAKYPGFSPFNYAINSPIKFMDPDGERIVDGAGNEVIVTVRKDDQGNNVVEFSGPGQLSEEEKAVFEVWATTKMGRRLIQKMNRRNKDIYPQVNTTDLRIGTLPGIIADQQGRYDDLANDAVKNGVITEEQLRDQNYIIAQQGLNNPNTGVAVVYVKGVMSEDNKKVAMTPGIKVEDLFAQTEYALSKDQLAQLNQGTLELQPSPFSPVHDNTLDEKIAIAMYQEVTELIRFWQTEGASRRKEAKLSFQINIAKAKKNDAKAQSNKNPIRDF